jgi:hypothetical protein
MRNKRSPLKDRPLRNPGQSLDEQIRDLVSDYALGAVSVNLRQKGSSPLLAFCQCFFNSLYRCIGSDQGNFKTRS